MKQLVVNGRKIHSDDRSNTGKNAQTKCSIWSSLTSTRWSMNRPRKTRKKWKNNAAAATNYIVNKDWKIKVIATMGIMNGKSRHEFMMNETKCVGAPKMVNICNAWVYKTHLATGNAIQWSNGNQFMKRRIHTQCASMPTNDQVRKKWLQSRSIC